MERDKDHIIKLVKDCRNWNGAVVGTQAVSLTSEEIRALANLLSFTIAAPSGIDHVDEI